MIRTRNLLLGLLLLPACTEYELNEEDDGTTDWKDADTAVWHPPVDTASDTAAPIDTSEPNDEHDCAEYVWPAEELPKVEECFVEVVVGTFTPVLEWDKQTWSVDPSSRDIMATPIVVSVTDDNGDGQIDENDTPDIAVITYGSGNNLRVISGADGAEILNLVGYGLQGQGAVAAGDIDGDGIVELIAPTTNGLMAFEHDGTVKWTNSSLSGHIYGTSDAPAISDMDGDGSPEIIMGSAILNADGSTRGLGAYGRGGVSSNVGTVSFAVDLDRDGTQEVITGNAIYEPDGSAIWHNGGEDGYVAVGNFDSDNEGEIVASGMGKVWLLDTDGTLLWSANIPGASSSYGGMPTVADYDGDGAPEIGVAANNSYTVFETDGSVLWQSTTQDMSSGNTGSAVFDFEGDGIAEAVYADETRLWVFKGPDGSVKLESMDHKSNTWTEYAVIADIDGDGHAEIVSPNNNSGGGGMYGITVIGDADNSWRTGRRIWNQHAYHITNVEEDGSIPAVAEVNWDVYNSFRSGDLTPATGAGSADLVVKIDDVCEALCDQGTLWVWLQVGNQGYTDANGATVRIWANTPDGPRVMASEDVDVAAATLNESMLFQFSGVDAWTINDLLVTIDGGNSADGGGTLVECNEENNEVTWGAPVCQ